MPTKLIGAFITALAITAFAALPSAAMAANVTLKEGSTTVVVGETVRATSTNFTFTGRPSDFTFACATTSIRGQVRTNPGTRITFRNGGRFDNAQGGDQCPLALTGGRITYRESVTFRKDITLQKTGSHITGRTEARFTFRFFDEARHPGRPIAVCNYEGEIEVTSTVGSDTFHVESPKDEEGKSIDAKLEAEGNVGECDEKGLFKGDFRLTRRDGTTEVKTN